MGAGASTAKTYLFYDVLGTMTKLVDITNYPDMGAVPAKLDTTDLSDSKTKTSIFGLQDIPDLTFEANYDKTAFETIDALTGVQSFELQFGEAGVNGIFAWSGEVRVFPLSGGVDEVRKMQVVCSASTEIVQS